MRQQRGVNFAKPTPICAPRKRQRGRRIGRLTTRPMHDADFAALMPPYAQKKHATARHFGNRTQKALVMRVTKACANVRRSSAECGTPGAWQRRYRPLFKKFRRTEHVKRL
ncbi:hypothetical protein MTO96_005511 [Rhipicephalus appendiculatus]